MRLTEQIVLTQLEFDNLIAANKIKDVMYITSDTLKMYIYTGSTMKQLTVPVSELKNNYIESAEVFSGGHIKVADISDLRVKIKERYDAAIAQGLTTLDLTDLDVSGVESFENMTSNIRGGYIKTIDVTGWDTSSATTFYQAIYNYGGSFLGVSEIIGVGGWNVSSAAMLGQVFGHSNRISYLDLTGWDISNADNIAAIFVGCSSLTKIDVDPDKWVIKSSANTTNMFSGAGVSRVTYVENPPAPPVVSTKIKLNYNTDSGLDPIIIPLTDYYTKAEVDEKLALKQPKLIAGEGITISAEGEIALAEEAAARNLARAAELQAYNPSLGVGYDLTITSQEEFDAWVDSIEGQDAAVGGVETVLINPGVYHAKKSVYIQGLKYISAYGVTVDARGGYYTVFRGKLGSTPSQCKVEGITVTGSNYLGSGGGALSCDNWVNCTVTGNTVRGTTSNPNSNGGGAAQCSNWVNCTVTGNTSFYGGGGAHFCDNWVNCTVTGNNISGYNISYGGGANYCDNWVNCTVTGNNAEQGGGAHTCNNWVNCIVTGNTATDNYGGGAAQCNNWIGCTVLANTGDYNIYVGSNWKMCVYTSGGGNLTSSTNCCAMSGFTLASETDGEAVAPLGDEVLEGETLEPTPVVKEELVEGTVNKSVVAKVTSFFSNMFKKK